MDRDVNPSLNVTIANVQFKSPIGVAPFGSHFGKMPLSDPQQHAEANAEILLKHVNAGAGYIYVTSPVITDPSLKKLLERARIDEKRGMPPNGPSTRTIRAGRTLTTGGTEGMHNLTSPFYIDPGQAKRSAKAAEMLMKILLEKKPKDIPIIANTVGFSDLTETYVDGAKRYEELGADLIELNFSCPFPPTMRGAVDDFFQKRFPPRFQGALIGDNPEIAEVITREVVKAVKIPVGAKLSPETGFPRIVGTVKRLRDAGAVFVQTVNSAVGIAPPDIYNGGKPLWPFADANPFCMSSGSWLRQICYRDVAAIGRFVPGIDIAAAGGLMQPEHCVEVMMLGATLVQLCTGVIEQGRNLIRQSNEFMTKFMVDQGYHSLTEIIGLGQKYITYNEDIHMDEKVVIEWDENKCTKCGRCLNNLCVALYSDRGKIRTRPNRCEGCGACTIGCEPGALKLVKRE